MRVIWTPRAAADLDHIVDTVGANSPDRAARIANRLYADITRLALMPEMGRQGLLKGTRELVFPGLPWIVVYRLHEDAVRVLRIRHGAQLWP